MSYPGAPSCNKARLLAVWGKTGINSRSLDDPAQTSTETWKCATCGNSHVGVPMCFAAEFRDMYANMQREERDTRALIGSDQCVIDQQWFFLRGCLEVPILGSEELFVWGLWVSVKEEDYDEVSDFWTLEGREKLHGPYKGRLANLPDGLSRDP
jgi:hypothetical protein